MARFSDAVLASVLTLAGAAALGCAISYLQHWLF